MMVRKSSTSYACLSAPHPGHLPMPNLMELNCQQFLDGSLCFCTEASTHRDLDSHCFLLNQHCLQVCPWTSDYSWISEMTSLYLIPLAPQNLYSISITCLSGMLQNGIPNCWFLTAHLGINFPWSHFQDTFDPSIPIWADMVTRLPTSSHTPVLILCPCLSPGALSFALNSQVGVDVASTFGKK